MNGQGPLLALEALTMRFGGVVALDSLSLEVRGGEVLGLIGPNGSGKTTCFNVVTGIYAPNAGRVMFAGREISRLAPQAVYRAGIARTFQRSRLCLPLSIFDNLMIGDHVRLDHGLWFNLVRRRAFKEQMERNFEESRGFIRTFNPALAERMFDAVATLPMIDRRRIEICRALIGHPKLLLLDEPSFGLAPLLVKEIFENMRVINREEGVSMLVVEQNAVLALDVADQAFLLETGRVVLSGTAAEIRKDDSVRKSYLGY